MAGISETIMELVGHPTEEEWFEFKVNWYEPHVIGEYISALSNAAALAGRDCGYLVWGVEDAAHEVVGTDFTWRRDVKGEPLEHYLARQVSPDVAFRFEEGDVSGARVVALAVPAASKAPTSFDGVRYQRVGSSKVNLAKHPDREAELFRALLYGPATMENTEAAVQELSFTRLFTYYAGRGVELREATFARNLGLLTHDGRYNLLAQLLSDDSRMPVRVSIFTGETKASPLYSVREFGNTCLLVSLDRVLDYLDVLNVVQADERNRVVERKDVPLMEAKPLREAVVNAFVHNRWVDGNAPMFTVYSDRLEVVSHGGIAPRQTVEGFFQGLSVPVNQGLSDILLQLHVSERSGRGVPTIVEAWGRGCYDFKESSIALTIPFNRIDAVGRAPDPAGAGRVRGRAALNRTQQRVLEEIRDNPGVNHRQLAAALGRGKTTVQNAVRFLRENGYIERVGSDRKGWWRVR